MDLAGLNKCNHVVGDPLELYDLRECPRCKGIGYYGSVSLDSSGHINIVLAGEALRQRIRKILREKLRASGYGFNYDLLSNVVDTNTLKAIKADIIRCMEYLVTVQNQSIDDGVFFKASEILSRIQDLRVEQNKVEPRQVDIAFTAIAASGKDITIFETLGRV